jgi:hypothetical protein
VQSACILDDLGPDVGYSVDALRLSNLSAALRSTIMGGGAGIGVGPDPMLDGQFPSVQLIAACHNEFKS